MNFLTGEAKTLEQPEDIFLAPHVIISPRFCVGESEVVEIARRTSVDAKLVLSPQHMIHPMFRLVGKSFARRHSVLIPAAGALDKEEEEGRGEDRCFIECLNRTPNSRNTHVSGGIDLSDSGGVYYQFERKERSSAIAPPSV